MMHTFTSRPMRSNGSSESRTPGRFAATLALLGLVLLGLASGCGGGASTSGLHTPAASVSYAAAIISGTVGQAIAADTPTLSNGTASGYASSPALPAGLSLDATTGVISGTPSATAPATAYQVSAASGSGPVGTTVFITVLAATGTPSLSYAAPTLTGTVGQAIAADAPTLSNGTATGYSISPALPAGLSLNPTSGIISGTPTAASATTTYTASAATGSGTASATLFISVQATTGAVPSLSYSAATIAGTVGQAITADTPTVRNGTPTSYSISPALPAGLHLNTATGVIAGTPTAASAATTYSVVVATSAGTASATLSVQVQGTTGGGLSLTYAAATIAGTVGQAIVADSPTLSGGTATGYTVSPALSAGLSLNAGTGVLSGTPTAAAVATTYTVSAATASGTATASVFIVVQAAPVAGRVRGFTGLYKYFPGSRTYVSQTASVMAANPWLRGGRIGVSPESICADSSPTGSTWASDISYVTGYSNPLDTLMIRLNGDPSTTWNIQNASSVTYMDQLVAGVVSVAKAAGITNFLFDPENYRTSNSLMDYDQGGYGLSPLLNSPALSRPAMCAQLRAFGKAFGTSLWSRVPNATLYTFFGPTVVFDSATTNGMPTSWPDSKYATAPGYNMIPYFFLGLLDACPATGHIADYMEQGSYYEFTGLASIQRNMTASKNWVSIFFPNETADIAKAATCWVPLPLIYANMYFQVDESGSNYPGAYYVTSAADRLAYFTRNAYYCLQQTPAGYLPGVYIEDYDPWGEIIATSNIPADWATGLDNAVSVYQGTTTLGSLMDLTALDATLRNAFSFNPVWASESQ